MFGQIHVQIYLSLRPFPRKFYYNNFILLFKDKKKDILKHLLVVLFSLRTLFTLRNVHCVWNGTVRVRQIDRSGRIEEV